MDQWASRRRGHLIGLALVAWLASPGPARAQQARDLDLQQLRLASGEADVLGVATARLPEVGRWHLRVGAHWAQSPVRLVHPTERTTVTRLVSHQLLLDLGGAWVPLPWLELSAALPVFLHQGADAASLALDATGLGDLRLTTKAALYRGERFSASVALPVSLPSGMRDAFAGSPGIVLRPSLLGEADLGGGLGVALETGMVLRGTEQWANLTQGPAVSLGLAGSWRLPVGDRSLTALATFTGEVGLDADGVEERPMEMLLGVRWRRPRGLSLTAAAGPGLTEGAGTPVWRALVMAGWSPSAGRPAGRPARPPHAAPRPQPPARPPSRAVAPEVRIDTAGQRLELTEPLYFAEDEDRILEASFPVLRQVAQTLLAHPEIRRVRVGGHTDGLGDAAYNLALSQRRVDGVVRFLVAEGVDPERLEAVGYGETQPVADNDTEGGRARNRRVEFTLMEVAR